MKILVVDDVEDNLELMRRWLTRRGHDVITASGGKPGVELTRSERPNLVFMDISMPGMSGTEAMKVIRQDSDISRTPIVALTAHALEDQRQEYLLAGANHVATKPIDFMALRALIDRFETTAGGADG